MRIPLAVAGDAPISFVDEFGYLHIGDWRVEWWVGGEDYWHVPAASASRRQRVLGNSPVVETVIRVPGGDVAWRAAAAASAEGGAVVVEFHNTAAVPVALGVALVAPDAIAQPMARPALHFTAPARSMAAEFGIELLVHPVSHGATWRCSIGPSHPDALPPIDAIMRGWQTLSRQGASIASGDDAIDDALTVARASLLLHSHTRERSAAAPIATALTLLGHEDEAERVRVAARVRPRRRGMPVITDIAPRYVSDSLALLADPLTAAGTVAAVRAQLVDDFGRRVIDVLPGANPELLRGRSVDIANLPTNYGPLSFALRWHGDKPALLWEAPPPKRRARITLRAPALDPEWSTIRSSGEVLLGIH